MAAHSSAGSSGRSRLKVIWQIPSEMPPCSIETYRRYCHVVRHYTTKIYQRFKYVLDPEGCKGSDWHIDHILSVYDAFNAGDFPIPWQLVVHPANLRLISSELNYAKGKRSDCTPVQLMKRIKKFEREHGKVFLPIEVNSRKTYEYVYNRTRVESMKERIAKDSSFTPEQIKSIIRKESFSIPAKPDRKHLRRCDYEYVIYAFIRQVKTRKQIAQDLGVSMLCMKKIFDRLRFPPSLITQYVSPEKINVLYQSLVNGVVYNKAKNYFNPVLIALMTLRYCEKLSFKRIAKKMNTTVRSVAVWYYTYLKPFEQEYLS
jgi:hypothetical protein